MHRFKVFAKLIYIHTAYLFFGLDQEYFYIMRANYFADFNMFHFAIGNYKKALKFSNNPRALAALGWCYSQIDQLDISLDYYRKSYQYSPSDIDIALGLAFVEFYNNNFRESLVIIDKIVKKNSMTCEQVNAIKHLYQILKEKQ